MTADDLKARVREWWRFATSAGCESTTCCGDRIAALEAALEKADYLVEFLLDTTCYPLTYGGKLRTMACNYNAARAKAAALVEQKKARGK